MERLDTGIEEPWVIYDGTGEWTVLSYIALGSVVHWLHNITAGGLELGTSQHKPIKAANLGNLRLSILRFRSKSTNEEE
eukprot:805602-Amphidinium_carterae.1